jgi:hypothetical protein
MIGWENCTLSNVFSNKKSRNSHLLVNATACDPLSSAPPIYHIKKMGFYIT